MELKGDEKITKVINTFLKPFELTCQLGLDFSYRPGENLITYTVLYVDKGANGFMESIERLNPEVNADIFLWSLLHEIGHHETIDEMTDDESYACDKKKKRLNKWIKKYNKYVEARDKGEKVKRVREPNTDIYYDVLDERLATEWAVNYANTHQKTLEKFWGKLSRAIKNFYEVNEIEV